MRLARPCSSLPHALITACRSSAALRVFASCPFETAPAAGVATPSPMRSVQRSGIADRMCSTASSRALPVMISRSAWQAANLPLFEAQCSWQRPRSSESSSLYRTSVMPTVRKAALNPIDHS